MDSNIPTQPSTSKPLLRCSQNSMGEMSAQKKPWTLNVCPTTGGQFEVLTASTETVDGLKRTVGKKRKIPKERISLLYKERLLKEGLLVDNGIYDGCTLTLLPNVESGLVSQKSESSVLQALDNLSESQVNDFLSGRSPLALGMRLGDHHVFVQLQLSTSAPISRRSYPSHRCTKKPSAKYPSQRSTTSTTTAASTQTRLASHHQGATSSASSLSLPSSSKAQPPPTALSSPSPSVSDSTATPVPPSISPLPTPPPSPTDKCQSSSNPHSNTASSNRSTPVPVLERAALAEAKRSLSRTLREFSSLQGPTSMPPSPPSSPLTPCATTSAPPTAPKVGEASPLRSSSCSNPGAIIDSMKDCGKGVYSGTFSGTLNPALQDREGKPKRNINTIVHILNDLLGASSPYKGRRSSRRTHRDCLQRVQRAKSLEECERVQQENTATRGKMEQLQVMMEERRTRRKARRQARSSPYSWGSRGAHAAATAQMHPMASPLDVPHGSMDVDSSLNADVGSYAELKQDSEAELQQESITA